MKMSNVNGAKKSEAMNSTILECKTHNNNKNNVNKRKETKLLNKYKTPNVATLGADDTVSEMNKTLTVKGPSGGGSDSVGKLMKNEGPLHIFYK